MKLKTYAGLSFIATLAIIYHAFNSRGQFYPAMVYLSTSKISLVLLLNMGLVFMCILWQLTKKIFLGSLREAEVERLNEQSWREVMEILFAITIFRQDFSVTFLAMVTALLLIKALHWLAQKRVEYIETTPSVPMLSHVRIVSFMGNFKVRVADYIRYRKITSNMNDRFPDATPEELTASDATCIICREEMTTAKKLICGHLFHVHCLRSWLERQHTCPTCRALVVPPENGTTGAVGPQGSQADGQRQGAATGGESTAQNEATDNLSRHQARLQAAAAAASIYEKSYVYPSANSFVCSPGYTLHPPVAESTNKDSSGGQTSREQTQSWFLTTGGPTNESYPPMQHFHLLPSQPYAALVNYGKGFENDPNIPSSHLEAYRKLLQCQIQILQNQLEILQETRSDRSVDEGTSSSDSRGKSVISSSEYEEIQDGKAYRKKRTQKSQHGSNVKSAIDTNLVNA
ncbi:hypothetical protein V8G54_017346 [Vigna mungo]|uniref:RING-type E3 ubiquitin transferase n=1 Tax=Vigna mungo TaxID=3915 RepID=A0AAQ3NPR1_VIGMU